MERSTKPGVIIPARWSSEIPSPEGDPSVAPQVSPSQPWDQKGADIGGLIRPLLEALTKLADLESTYLVVFDWEHREQEVRYVFSAGEPVVEEGHRIPLPADVSEEAFPGVTRSPAKTDRAEPDSLVARSLGLKAFVSVPVTVAKHRVFGMLCGASRQPHQVSETVVGMFESFAGIVGEHLMLIRMDASEDRAVEAESQLLTRARFLAEAEHRMKTLLSILEGTALTLHHRREGLSESDRVELEESMIRNVAVLSQELESLLLEARADIRTRELDPVDVDLGAMAREIATAFNGLGSDHHVLADIAGEVKAHVDHAATSQILGHLIDNAIKYSPAGGSITVRAAETADAIALEVIDEGVGLPPLVDVFAPFRRGEQQAQTPGIGLGLHIVRNLVEAMGGTVTARNNPDAGSTFTVILPVGE